MENPKHSECSDDEVNNEVGELLLTANLNSLILQGSQKKRPETPLPLNLNSMPSEATCLQLKLEQHFIANNNLSIATITTEEQRVMRQFFHNALKKQADLSPENITPEQEASLMRLLPQEQARAPVKKAEFAGRPKLAARRRLPKSAPLQDAKASSVGANRHKANDSSSIVNPY